MVCNCTVDSMQCFYRKACSLQARDLLQHLWTGPISNAPVDIVQGSKSVEVRPVGISKVTKIPAQRHSTVLACCCAATQCLRTASAQLTVYYQTAC
jgi:Trehalose-phosphatase